MTPSQLKNIKNLARKITNPKSYFRGVPLMEMELPKNLLMFHRCKKEDFDLQLAFHYHDRFVLIINLQTEGKLVVDGVRFDFKPEQAYLVFPYQFHHYLEIAKDNLDWLFITFELFETTNFESMRNRVMSVSDSGYSYLSSLVEHYNNKVDEQATNPIPIFLLTTMLMLELQAHPLMGGKEHQPMALPTIDKVNGYIWDNLNKEIKLPELAEKFMLSESHMRLLFRKKMGISIGSYIKHLRINKARSFLLNTDFNISEIASLCGYNSLFTFSRAFKNMTGMSPEGYRKALKTK
ncbi:MAG: helix-turn-helix transcriptional regulator [Fibrobacteria bacterium]|nr:helix-turn-helix transcriptional regulator [Fibrobacteria bacterium]